MDFYHWWIYENVLNAKWFVWSVVVFVFAFNFLGPILVWFVMNSKPIPFLRQGKKKKNQEKKDQKEQI